MKKVILFFVLFIPLILIGQEISFENPPLRKIIKKADSLNIRGKYIQSIQLIQNSTLQLSDIEQAYLNFKIANIFRKRRVLDSAAYYIDIANDLIKDHSITDKIKFQKHSTLGNYFYSKKIYDSAIYNHLEALKVANRLKNFDLKFQTYLNIARCFIILKNFEKAEKYIQKAEKSISNPKDTFKEIHLLEVTLFMYTEKNELSFVEDKIKYFLQLSISKDYARGKMLAYGYLSMISVMKSYDDMLEYANKSKEIVKNMEFNDDIKKLVKNIDKLNELEKLKVHSDSVLLEGLDIFNENKKIIKKNGFDLENTITTKRFIDASKIVPNYDKEIKVFSQAINKDYEVDQLQKSIKNQDSIYQEQLKSKTDELETKYRTKEKELTIEKEKKRKQEYAGIAILTLISLLFFIYYAYTRKKQIEHKNKLTLIQIEYENKLTLIQIEHKNKLALVTARQEAHNEIGIELHDVNAKDLERISMKLEKKGDIILASEVTEIKDTIRHLSAELRFVSFEESPFLDQLITLGTDYSNESRKIKLSGVKDIDWLLIPDSIKRNLFLVIREGVSNATNHGKASIITITCKKTPKKIEISVIDNGIGFDQEKVVFGSGIRNIKMRIRELNGTIEFKSTAQKGTSLYITIAT